MKRRGALLALVSTIALVAAPASFLPAPVSAAADRVSANSLLAELAVRSEARAGTYSRAAFGTWIDADHDGENSRVEVLRAESRQKVTIGSAGAAVVGRWVSSFDGTSVTRAASMSVAHLVPLAEAWVSGASAWSTRKRTAYANDLGFGPSLLAVSKHDSAARGRDDPAEYLPRRAPYRCNYVRRWIAVKSRWHLSVDRAEKKALVQALRGACSSTKVTRPGKPDLAGLVGDAWNPADHGWIPRQPDLKSIDVAVIGDSYTSGSPEDTREWPSIVSADMHLTIQNLAVRGTGYVATNPSLAGSGTFGARARLVSPSAPVVLFFGSRNDAHFSESQVRAAALRAFRIAEIADPEGTLVVVGVPWVDGSPPADVIGARDGLRAAANAVGALYVDPIDEHWFASDGLIGKDGVHPTDAGHLLLAGHMEAIITGPLAAAR